MRPLLSRDCGHHLWQDFCQRTMGQRGPHSWSVVMSFCRSLVSAFRQAMVGVTEEGSKARLAPEWGMESTWVVFQLRLTILVFWSPAPLVPWLQVSSRRLRVSRLSYHPLHPRTRPLPDTNSLFLCFWGVFAFGSWRTCTNRVPLFCCPLPSANYCIF